jgi:methionyl-tRNA formyltransferase
MTRVKAAALVGRAPGLAVLNDALIGNPLIEIVKVFTHGRLPRAEGGGDRPELADYRGACEQAGFPLVVLDGPEGRDLAPHLPAGVELLVAVSWRNLVPGAVLDRLNLGAINLHRGALPAYAGAEPVRRAIEAGETHAVITAHWMVTEIDAGDEIARVSMQMPARPAELSPAVHAETVKAMLIPLYAPLARLAIVAALSGRQG